MSDVYLLFIKRWNSFNSITELICNETCEYEKDIFEKINSYQRIIDNINNTYCELQEEYDEYNEQNMRTPLHDIFGHMEHIEQRAWCIYQNFIRQIQTLFTLRNIPSERINEIIANDSDDDEF